MVPIISTINHHIYGRKSNCLVGITGSVNTGKSNSAVYIGSRVDKKFKVEESLVYSVENLIDRSLSFIKFKGKKLNLDKIKDVTDIRDWLKTNMDDIYITPGKVIIMDETGALGAYVREFFSMDNKTLAKIIQIWRILRMLCIFVVPEDMKMAESTITKFLNIEIKMLNIDKKEKTASCIAWEYKGWNKKTKEPYRYRLVGCRNGGVIHIPKLHPKILYKYETFSRSEKIGALIDMGREYKVNNINRIKDSKTIYDDIQYVQKNIEQFKNEKGLITVPMIKARLGVSVPKAQQIRAHILSTHTI